MTLHGSLHGVSGSRGVAVGPMWTIPTAPVTSPPPEPGEGRRPGFDADAATKALDGARGELEHLVAARRAAGDVTSAEILAVQAQIAGDPTLRAAIETHGGGAGESAIGPRSAVELLVAAGEAQAAALEAIPDEYLAARAADVRDVVARAVRILTGATVPRPPMPSIVIADDLPPSISAEIPRELLLGIALRDGSRTAHAVIIARAAGIPCIVATEGLATDGSLDGVSAALDGDAGVLYLSPSDEVLARLRAAAVQSKDDAARRAQLRGTPCLLKGGERVHLLANIGSVDDAHRAVEVGADGIGLLRTEFLLLDRSAPPTEAELVAAFRAIFATIAGGARGDGASGSERGAGSAQRPVTVRLADIGGDKEIPYLRIPHEENPFLGVRGYRLAMLPGRADLRELFAAQVRAALIAAASTGVVLRVMAPMIVLRHEVEDLIALVASVRAELAVRGSGGDAAATVAAGYPLQLGVMIETPAAALTVAEIARGLDFVSIGTNDLTQYTMAADRVNPAFAALQDATTPAVVALMRAVVDGAAKAGVEVGVCGELAGSIAGAKLLVGLGIRELSADPAVIDEVREALIGA